MPLAEAKKVISTSETMILEVEKIKGAIEFLRILDCLGAEPDPLRRLGLAVLHGLYRCHVGEFPTEGEN